MISLSLPLASSFPNTYWLKFEEKITIRPDQKILPVGPTHMSFWPQQCSVDMKLPFYKMLSRLSYILNKSTALHKNPFPPPPICFLPRLFSSHQTFHYSLRLGCLNVNFYHLHWLLFTAHGWNYYLFVFHLRNALLISFYSKLFTSTDTIVDCGTWSC